MLTYIHWAIHLFLLDAFSLIVQVQGNEDSGHAELNEKVKLDGDEKYAASYSLLVTCITIWNFQSILSEVSPDGIR